VTVRLNIRNITAAFLYCFLLIAGMNPSKTPHKTVIIDKAQSRDPKHSNKNKTAFQSHVRTVAASIQEITIFFVWV
jgi:hypothetical protein